MYKGINFTNDYRTLPRSFWSPYEPEECGDPKMVR